jgi:hypothetical protein
VAQGDGTVNYTDLEFDAFGRVDNNCTQADAFSGVVLTATDGSLTTIGTGQSPPTISLPGADWCGNFPSGGGVTGNSTCTP